MAKQLLHDIQTFTVIHQKTCDSPVSASTPGISLWQMDLVAMKMERFIGAKVLRSDAVAKITGANYTGGSP